MKKIRVGVIGVGYVSKNNFLPVLPRFDDVEFVGLMAREYEHAKNAQRLCGAQNVVHDLGEMVDLGLDCAFVLTPKQTHAEQISFLLEHGVDVYCEKPMATTLKDAAAIAELSEKTGHKLMIGFNRRYAPVCLKAKEALREHPIDVIIGQKNRPQKEYRATLENAIHIVDLLRFFGGEVKDVTALTRYQDDPYFEDFTTAQLCFESGASGILVADRGAGQWDESISILGGNQTVQIRMPDSVTITDEQEAHTTTMTPLAMGWAKSEDKLGFTNAIRHFLDCVRDDKTPLPNAQDAFKTHQLLDRILRSAGLPSMD